KAGSLSLLASEAATDFPASVAFGDGAAMGSGGGGAGVSATFEFSTALGRSVLMLLYAGLCVHPEASPMAVIRIAKLNPLIASATSSQLIRYLSVNAATPGSTSPARNSSEAPPPVDT